MVQNVDEDFQGDCDWDFQICVGDMTYDLQTQNAFKETTMQGSGVLRYLILVNSGQWSNPVGAWQRRRAPRDGTRIDYYWGAQARDQPP